MNCWADASGLRRSVGFRIPEGDLTCVTGIGSELWARLFGDARPAELHPFQEIRGGRHTAVATDGDLLFHLRAHRLDLCFELAGLLVARLSAVAQVIDEVHGFRSFDERDLLGFVDGTENPEDRAAIDAVRIGDEDPAYGGGSYTIVQKYLHDIPAWRALPVRDQELAVGRTKLEDVELADDVKPANSHVALNTIEDADGNQLQIVRHNMPFGQVGANEFGTYFIGYARTPRVIEEMLRNMFVGKPPGNHDRLLDFSTAVTGTLFFVPRRLHGRTTGPVVGGEPRTNDDHRLRGPDARCRGRGSAGNRKSAWPIGPVCRADRRPRVAGECRSHHAMCRSLRICD